MGRTIGAVIAGYFVMFAVVFGLFSAVYMMMGADRAFKPGSYEPSNLWILIMFIGGFVAAVMGGWVCMKIAQETKAIKALAVLVLVLGVLCCAIPTLTAKPVTQPRTAGLSNMEAMKNARTPAWVALANPVIAVAGVLIGGRRRMADPNPSPL